jgi:hypothetical protein
MSCQTLVSGRLKPREGPRDSPRGRTKRLRLPRLFDLLSARSTSPASMRPEELLPGVIRDRQRQSGGPQGKRSISSKEEKGGARRGVFDRDLSRTDPRTTGCAFLHGGKAFQRKETRHRIFIVRVPQYSQCSKRHGKRDGLSVSNGCVVNRGELWRRNGERHYSFPQVNFLLEYGGLLS